MTTDELVQENIALAYHWAQKYGRGDIDPQTFEEIVSDAFLGLVRASRRFDATRGLRFSTYASVAIIRSIQYGWNRRRVYQNRWLSLDNLLDEQQGLEHLLTDNSPSHERLTGHQDTLEHLFTEAALDSRERKAIRLYYGEGRAFREVGKKLGLTHEQARRIVRNAFDKLREVASQ